MAYGQGQKLVVTTAADGSATATSQVFTGRIYSIYYEKVDFADGVDFTITAEAGAGGPAENIWVESNVNAATTRSPSVPTHDQLGVATGSSDYIYLVGQCVKVVIANGGNVKTGNFYIKVW